MCYGALCLRCLGGKGRGGGGGYGEMVIRGMGRREEKEKKRNGGGALIYPKNQCLPQVRHPPSHLPEITNFTCPPSLLTFVYTGRSLEANLGTIIKCSTNEILECYPQAIPSDRAPAILSINPFFCIPSTHSLGIVSNP